MKHTRRGDKLWVRFNRAEARAVVKGVYHTKMNKVCESLLCLLQSYIYRRLKR